MFIVYFINNITHEKQAIEIFSQRIQAVNYCSKNGFRVNRVFLTPRGHYVIERK